VAIVDYGLGNLFSVSQACRRAGLETTITSSRAAILDADAVILPGVGAFGNAMSALERLDLVSPIRDIAASGSPLLGICLGFQLLMTESSEFGRCRGLGILEGEVLRLPDDRSRRLKVPQVGWNQIVRGPGAPSDWIGSPLAGVPDGAHMYLVHSYFVRPAEVMNQLSMTRHGDVEFCSSVWRENIFASQFHPERSGEAGLSIYRNLRARMIERKEKQDV